MELILIIHNVRSAHNVGSMLRTADAAGISKVLITGITPYPPLAGDPRPPHVRIKAGRAIGKTALGAENYLNIEPADLETAIYELKGNGFTVCALEQAKEAVDLFTYQPPVKAALIVGSETEGLPTSVLQAADTVLEIPMRGRKESLNVAVAAGIALYRLAVNPR